MEKRRELKELRKEIENFQRIVVAVSKERDFYCRVVLIIVVSVITVVWYSFRRIKNEENKNKNKNSPPPDISLETTDAENAASALMHSMHSMHPNQSKTSEHLVDEPVLDVPEDEQMIPFHGLPVNENLTRDGDKNPREKKKNVQSCILSAQLAEKKQDSDRRAMSSGPKSRWH